MEKKFVLKIGGSLLFDENLELRENKINQFAEIIKNTKNIVAIIVGGGKVARKYISAAEKLNAGKSLCDMFGIRVSRINALLLITALGDKAYPEPITRVENVRTLSIFDRIIVSGGFIPGQSTTSVALEVAEAIGATDVLISTDVDGVYNKDPNKYKDAKKYVSISISELEKVIFQTGSKNQSDPGEYRIFDAVSFHLLKRNNMELRFINGEKMSDLKKILIEKDYEANIGTKVLRD